VRQKEAPRVAKVSKRTRLVGLNTFNHLIFLFKIKIKNRILLEQLVAQIQKKLTEAFDVFDGDKTKTVDAKYNFHKKLILNVCTFF
jgi:hypothetical protein